MCGHMFESDYKILITNNNILCLDNHNILCLDKGDSLFG
ncbi:hypothetical protein ACJIZ3_011217 [Penstemon smallii]|uniref:Uncharacterized protein n=1 Tax=Penstemon smallii TaxID=265156 RepID=A0ABD3UIW8_9LAMI